jgi:hypothetical protein
LCWLEAVEGRRLDAEILEVKYELVELPPRRNVRRNCNQALSYSRVEEQRRGATLSMQEEES